MTCTHFEDGRVAISTSPTERIKQIDCSCSDVNVSQAIMILVIHDPEDFGFLREERATLSYSGDQRERSSADGS